MDNAVDKRRAEMEARLQERELQRQQELEKRRQQRADEGLPDENVEIFTKQFNSRRQEITAKLEQSHLSTIPKDQLSSHFDALIAEIKTLQELVTRSARFLPAFDIKQSQDAITKLQQDTEKLRTEMVPRKKFAFSSGKKTSVASSSIAAAAAAAPSSSAASEVESSGTATIFSHSKKRVVDPAYSFQSQKDVEILQRSREDIKSHDFALCDLERSKIFLCSRMTSMYIHSLTDCIVLCGPVSGSVYVENCKGCIFVAASRQMRIHATENCRFYVHTTSGPIIEHCSNVLFAPYNLKYDGLEQDFAESELDKTRNLWDKVEDFRWLKANMQSPNWNVVPEAQRVLEFTVEGCTAMALPDLLNGPKQAPTPVPVVEESGKL